MLFCKVLKGYMVREKGWEPLIYISLLLILHLESHWWL